MTLHFVSEWIHPIRVIWSRKSDSPSLEDSSIWESFSPSIGFVVPRVGPQRGSWSIVIWYTGKALFEVCLILYHFLWSHEYDSKDDISFIVSLILMLTTLKNKVAYLIVFLSFHQRWLSIKSLHNSVVNRYSSRILQPDSFSWVFQIKGFRINYITWYLIIKRTTKRLFQWVDAFIEHFCFC